ncbi:RHS repeat protein, partial [Actinospica durhamensis]|nr:RHS repeat protein [Actinospica durhamensis]
PIGPGMPTRVALVDGSGAGHLFVLAKHGSADPLAWDYQSPAGVHLYLQRTGSADPDRAWVLTRPDRTQFFFGLDGVASAIVDRVGNTVAYQYAEPAGAPFRHLLAVVDAAGRRTLTFHYRGQTTTTTTTTTTPPAASPQAAQGAAAAAHASSAGASAPVPAVDVPGGAQARIDTITDLAGHVLTFGYDPAGRLIALTEAAGSPVARTFGFGYAAATAGATTSTAPAGPLTSVIDPLGHSTRLAYFPATADRLHRQRVSTLIDRAGGSRSFDYVPARAGGPGLVDSVMTDPDGHRTVLALDAEGRTVRATDALGQSTDLGWDADDDVVRLREADGAVFTWVYAPGTGLPLTIADAVANAAAGPGRAPAATTLDYRSSLGGHVADLLAQTSPEGRRWTFGVDGYGEPVSVTDPLGNAVGPEHGEFRQLRYDRYGDLLASADGAGRTTRYADFTAAGLPQTTTDPFGVVTRTRYDALGEITSTEAPTGPHGLPLLSTCAYDALGRALTSTVTVGAAPAEVTPAPVYDADDDVLRREDPSQGTTYSRYDAMNRLLSQTDPVRPDAGTDPRALPQTTYTYDLEGDLLTETAPLGNTPAGAGGYVTRYRYDPVGRLIQTTDAFGGRTTVRYDAVGDAVEQIDPRGNASTDPSAWAHTTVYDLDHRPILVTDASGDYTVTRYDLDGLVTDRTAEPVDPSVPDTDAGLRPYLTHTTRDADGRVVESDPPRDDESDAAAEPEPDGEW